MVQDDSRRAIMRSLNTSDKLTGRYAGAQMDLEKLAQDIARRAEKLPSGAGVSPAEAMSVLADLMQEHARDMARRSYP